MLIDLPVLQGEGEIRGLAKVGKMTKQLVHRLGAGDIAVIRHQDLDAVSAESLIARGVKAVLNAKPFTTGAFPNRGPRLLASSGIPMLEIEEEAFLNISDNEHVLIRGELVDTGAHCYKAKRVSSYELWGWSSQGKQGYESLFSAFKENTLEHAMREKQQFPLPFVPIEVNCRIHHRMVLVVARGPGHREDLRALYSFLRAARPVLVGVDGGADTLLELEWQPDLIIGDMDSVSEQALICGAELIVHSYVNGDAPGERRLAQLGLPCQRMYACGTSEDAALQLVYQLGAEGIILIGGHFGMLDFLEKGRSGMASTLLTRMMVGDKLIDARGYARLAGCAEAEKLRKLNGWK
jgi:uncharacterized membrane-anchored protein